VAGRTFGATLTQNLAAGMGAWLGLFNPRPSSEPDLGYPKALVGGQGAAPWRYYLASNRDRRLGGSSLHRSDDDGATWSQVLSYRGGGTPGYSPPGDDPNVPSVQMPALAYDPAQPDVVYVGRLSYPSYFSPPDAGGVSVSRDGGASWSDLGRQDIGPVHDVALGIDGRNLYAATDLGVWQLEIP
jgi:hypothetical protein